MVRVCLALLTILAMTGVSVAQNQTCFRLPPSKYRHEPTQPYTIRYVKPEEIRRYCHRGLTAFAPTFAACASQDTREIFIPDNLSGAFLRCTIQHEKAHLNGWPYNHPLR